MLARELPGADTFEAFRCGEEADIFRAEVERRARELGLPRLRWPEPFPFDSALAMRVATFARSIGRAVPFAQAAFRQAFAGGHSLEDPDFVLIAAAACELHPDAVKRAAGLRSVAEQLAATTAEAAAAGVRDVPAVLVRGRGDGDGDGGDGGGDGNTRVFTGERELERAGAALRG